MRVRWRAARFLAAMAFVPSIIGAVFSTFSLPVAAGESPWPPDGPVLQHGLRWAG